MSDSAENLTAMLAAVRAEYVAKLPQQVADMERLWLALAAGRAPLPRIGDLARNAHNLAGSGATFGFLELSAQARKLELFLVPFCSPARLPAPDEQMRVSALISAVIAATLPE